MSGKLLYHLIALFPLQHSPSEVKYYTTSSLLAIFHCLDLGSLVGTSFFLTNFVLCYNIHFLRIWLILSVILLLYLTHGFLLFILSGRSLRSMDFTMNVCESESSEKDLYFVDTGNFVQVICIIIRITLLLIFPVATCVPVW